MKQMLRRQIEVTPRGECMALSGGLDPALSGEDINQVFECAGFAPPFAVFLERDQELAEAGAHALGNLDDAHGIAPAGNATGHQAGGGAQGVARFDNVPGKAKQFAHVTGVIKHPNGFDAIWPSLNTVWPRSRVRNTRPRSLRPAYGVWR